MCKRQNQPPFYTLKIVPETLINWRTIKVQPNVIQAQWATNMPFLPSPGVFIPFLRCQWDGEAEEEREQPLHHQNQLHCLAARGSHWKYWVNFKQGSYHYWSLDRNCRQVGLSSSLFPSPYLSLPGSVLLPPLKPCSANYFPFPSDGWCGRFDHGLLHHSSTSSLLKRTSWRLGGPLYVLESKILLNQISNRAKRFQTLIGMLCNKTEKLGGITKEGCIFLASLTPQEVTWK